MWKTIKGAAIVQQCCVIWHFAPAKVLAGFRKQKIGTAQLFFNAAM
jgi:hypothetical protein